MDLEGLRRFIRRRFSREEAVGLYFTLSFLACAVFVVAFGILAREVVESKAHPEPVDFEVGGYLASIRSPGRTTLMRGVTLLGDYRFLLLGTAGVVTGLLLTRHRVSALLFVGSVLGGFGLESALKIAFARARPALWPALVTETTYSFPSGHSTMATVFFGGIVAVVMRLSRRRAVRVLALAAALLCVAGVATSRVYLGAHWATDTFGGVLVGLFWVAVFDAGTEYVAGRARRAAAARRS